MFRTKIAEAVYRFLASGILYVVVFSSLSLLIILLAICSFRWCFGVDNDPMLYSAYLTDKFGQLPYRDFFYIQMPGVQVYYLLIIKVFGYSYAGFRIADMLFTIVFFLSSFMVLRKLNWKTALAASIVFLILYFKGSSLFALQRDYVLLLPIILAILITIYFPAISSNIKFLIAGFLCAISMQIKPYAVLAYPFIFLFQVWYFDDYFFKPSSLKKTVRSAFLSLTGFLFVLTSVLLYLLLTNSLSDFQDTFLYFHPLYRKLYNPNGNVFVPSPDSFSYHLFGQLKFGGQRLLLIPAIIGVYVALRRSQLLPSEKKLVYLFIALAVVFDLNVVLAGKYFDNHWIPFSYCLFVLASLCFVIPCCFKKYTNAGKLLPLAAIYVAIIIKLIHYGPVIKHEFEFDSKKDLHRERVEDVSEFLKSNMKSNDRVLTLDMLGYSLASVMLSNARPATSFVSPWYLNIEEISGEEYVQKQRSKFLLEMEGEKPRYILDFDGFKWFSEFQNILDTKYNKLSGKYYIIYTRKE